MAKTEIKLRGTAQKIDKFLEKKGIEGVASGDELILGTIIGEEPTDTPFGKIGVAYEAIENTTGVNNVVIIDFTGTNFLHAGRTHRKVSVNRDGIGKQHFRKGLELVVVTDHDLSAFKKKGK